MKDADPLEDAPLVYIYRSERQNPDWICGRLTRRVKSDIRDDMAVMTLEESLHPQDYTRHKDREHLLIATRWDGETLFPLSRASMPVYICDPTVCFCSDGLMINSNSIQISDWAELCQTLNSRDDQIRAGYIRPVTKIQADLNEARRGFAPKR